MSQNPTTRRTFLGRTALAGGLCLLGGRSAQAQPQLPPANGPNPMVRVDISKLDPNGTEIASLIKGITEMKRRSDADPNDPTGWVFQASIHGSTDPNPSPAWNQCQHGNWWFFPWHRAYLYYFERILRDAAGDSNLTLPYWNWNSPFERPIPAPFLDPNSTLFDPTRQMDDGSWLPPRVVVTNLNFALAQLTFLPSQVSAAGFGGQSVQTPGSYPEHGQLESSPHDDVHVLVGGNMSDPRTAALDPIFWLHHCNIDRLWTQWLASGFGRANPTDSLWRTQAFAFFDERKNPVTITADQVLDTVKNLNYRYDDQLAPATPVAVAAVFAVGGPPMPPHGAGPELVVASAAPPAPQTLGAKPVTVAVKLPAEAKPHINKAFRPLGAVAAVPPVIRLKIEGVEFTKNPGVVYQVFLNLPKGEVDTSADEVHYVGNLTFFAKQHGHGAIKNAKADHVAGAAEALPGFTQTFDVTRVVRGLEKLGQWNEDELSVTLIPLGPVPKGGKAAGVAPPKPPEPKAPVTFRRVSLSVGP